VDNSISINRSIISSTQDIQAQKNPAAAPPLPEKDTAGDPPLDEVRLTSLPPLGEKTSQAGRISPGKSEKVKPQPEKEVTVLLYMDGQYPDLEATMASIPLGLETLGSNQDMNVVVELGRAPQSFVHPEGGFDRIDNDWEGVRRYYVTKSDAQRTESVTLGDWLDIARENPDNPLVHFVLGEVCESQGMAKESEAAFKRAEELGYMKFFREPFNPQVKEWSQEFQRVLQPLRDKDAASNIYTSPVTQDLGTGVDMKQPSNLKDFVAWGMKNYPAKHYVVVLGGHGGAWTGALQMSPSDMGMALQAGVNQANRSTGRRDGIDALVLNSCYMGNLESVNEMRNSADVIIASEMSAKSSVLTDWPEILSQVQEDISSGRPFTAREFARDFVGFYKEKGDQISTLPLMRLFSKERYLTCAAVDTSKVENISSAWSTFVSDWKSLGVPDQEIYHILAESKNYPSFAYSPEMLFDYGTLRDLGNIADNLAQSEKLPPRLREDAENIRKALNEAIIAEQHTGHDMENSTGLSVWAPTNASDIALMAAPYGKRVPDFVQATNWDKKLVEAQSSADPQVLSRFMAGVKLLAQVQQALRNDAVSADEKEKLESKMKTVQAEVMRLREQLSLAGENVEITASTAGGTGEPSREKTSPEKDGTIRDEEYVEGHLKKSQAQDGMSHGRGVLNNNLQEGEGEALSLLTDRIIKDSQMFDGMGHMSSGFLGV